MSRYCWSQQIHFPTGFYIWHTGYLWMCKMLVSETFHFLSIIDFQLHTILVGKDTWYNFNVKLVILALCIAYNQIWRMFHLYLERMCILVLLNKMFSICLLCPFRLLRYSSLLEPNYSAKLRDYFGISSGARDSVSHQVSELSQLLDDCEWEGTPAVSVSWTVAKRGWIGSQAIKTEVYRLLPTAWMGRCLLSLLAYEIPDRKGQIVTPGGCFQVFCQDHS